MSGTVAFVEHNEFKLFTRSFVCLIASQVSFGQCLPIIVLDACSIKNRFKGVVMAACTIDGAGQLVPLAFATCGIENSDSWAWFLEHLCINMVEVLDSNRPVTVLSDHEKGLHNALIAQIPNVHHCFCVKHIEKNIKSKFQISFGEKLWIAAKTMNLLTFNQVMEKMKHMHPQAFEYLRGIELSAWTWIHSPLPRFSHSTSNVAECFNNWIGDSRDSSHFAIHVSIVRKIMQLYAERRQLYAGIVSMFPKELSQEIRQQIEEARRMQVHMSSKMEAIVSFEGHKYFVNLSAKKCSCGFFFQLLRPCSHAVALIKRTSLNVSDFVAEYYRSDCLQAVYAPTVHAVTIEDLDLDETLPPKVLCQAGCSKVTRIRNRSELENDQSPVVCSRCGLRGHNMRTCERRQRGQRVERH